MDSLASALQYLKGVGPRRAADLQRAGLHTIEDLLYRFPIRYEDRGHFQTIASLRPGVAASIIGEVVSAGVRPTRRPRFRIFELLVRDATGSIRAIWFNQPFLADVFHPHQRVILFGKLELTPHGMQLQNPQYEVLRQAAAGESAGQPAEPGGDLVEPGRELAETGGELGGRGGELGGGGGGAGWGGGGGSWRSRSRTTRCTPAGSCRSTRRPEP